MKVKIKGLVMEISLPNGGKVSCKLTLSSEEAKAVAKRYRTEELEKVIKEITKTLSDPNSREDPNYLELLAQLKDAFSEELCFRKQANGGPSA
jgi:hypothetical protein